MLHLKWTELLKNGVLLLEVHIIEISQLWNLSQQILEINLLVLKNYKLRQEMTVWNSTTMESLNFHLFEIVQQALLWINSGLNPLGLISISAMQIIVFWLIVYLVSSTISQTVLLISMVLKISIKKIILPYMKINTLFRLHLLVNLFTMMSSSMNIPWIIRPRF